MRTLLSRIFFLVRLLIPWVIRFAFFAINWMLKALAAQFRGMPGAVNQIAQDWTINALVYGKIPLEFEKHIRWVMKTIAWGLIIFGYILSCHVVVWIVRRIF